MTFYIKTYTAILFYALLNSSCDSTKEKTVATDIKPVAIAIENDSVMPVKVILKETVLTEKTMIAGHRLATSAIIDEAGYRSLSIKLIDSTFGAENGFKYHIVDSLLSYKGINVLLIGRKYESENYIWITVYNSQNKLIDYKTVYYDNAEGFLSVETIIKNNRLEITTFNEYAETEKEKKITELYFLNENNRIVKQ